MLADLTPQYTNPLGGFGSFPKKFIQRRHEEAPPFVAQNIAKKL